MPAQHCTEEDEFAALLLECETYAADQVLPSAQHQLQSNLFFAWHQTSVKIPDCRVLRPVLQTRRGVLPSGVHAVLCTHPNPHPPPHPHPHPYSLCS